MDCERFVQFNTISKHISAVPVDLFIHRFKLFLLNYKDIAKLTFLGFLQIQSLWNQLELICHIKSFQNYQIPTLKSLPMSTGRNGRDRRRQDQSSQLKLATTRPYSGCTAGTGPGYRRTLRSQRPPPPTSTTGRRLPPLLLLPLPRQTRCRNLCHTGQQAICELLSIQTSVLESFGVACTASDWRYLSSAGRKQQRKNVVNNDFH